jgi:uroporphyrinogen decarboxylase
MMTSRERFTAALTGTDADRIPIYELYFWPSTLKRWRMEGLPADVMPQQYFDLDKAGIFSYGLSLGFQVGTIEEDETSSLVLDSLGVYRRVFKQGDFGGEYVKATITSAEDWQKHARNLVAQKQLVPELMPYDNITGIPTRCRTMREYYDLCTADGRFRVLTVGDPIDVARQVMGEEQFMYNIADEPEFIRLIVEDFSRFNEAMLSVLHDMGYHFDAMWVFSDLCYKNGMFISPHFYRENILPSFRRYVALCHEAGARFIFHSDGNISDLLPLLMEAGVDCMQPLEARAGNDIRELIPKYGDRMSFMGNINADVLATTHEKIEAEIASKIACGKTSRRYIFHSDHSIAPLVSMENYGYAVSLARLHGQY